MTNRIITAPSVIPFAVPSILASGLNRFISDQDLADVAESAGTPLNRIVSHVNEKVSASNTDAEVLIEFGGRQCYRAWEKGRGTDDYLKNILAMKHGSVLAHSHFTFIINGVSRSLTHELVRHAAGVDISQESQRFVDAEDVNFVAPPMLLDIWEHDTNCSDAQDWLSARQAEVEDYLRWQEEVEAYLADEARFPLDPYLAKLPLGLSDEERLRRARVKRDTVIRKRANEAARASLPNATETKLQWTANVRSLRHILALRGAEDADLEIRRFAVELGKECERLAPAAFYDIEFEDGHFDVPVLKVAHEKV